MNSRWNTKLLRAALVLVTGLAWDRGFAEEVTPKKATEQGEIRARQEAAGLGRTAAKRPVEKAESPDRPVDLGPALLAKGRTLLLTGRIDSAEDGRILLERRYEAAEVPGFIRMNYLPLKPGQGPRGKSYSPKLQLVYEAFAVDGRALRDVERVIGQEVTLTLRQRAQGGWLVVRVR